MLTGMTEDDWAIVLQVFAAAQSRCGQPGQDDRKFLEALHFFTVHNLTWRALPATFGLWNSIWKRFWRLSRSGVIEAFFQLLAETSKTGIWCKCSTARPFGHMSPLPVPKGDKSTRLLGALAAAFAAKSTSKPTLTVCRSPSI